MSEDDLCWWPAHRVARAVAARELSATEYLDVLLDRVEQCNPALGLVVTVDERARNRARTADRMTALGRPLGPLHGVAMTVKDSLATAGLRTTAGSEALAAYRPTADAEAVAALRAAGAIVFGKTNVPPYCADLQTHSKVAGTARNPWNPQYSTGGSSGGAAGAVALGLTPLELGSDIAGSIRVPASHCGVHGHKPSYGIVPTAGHIPPFQPVEPDLCVVGPLARCVEDLDIALTAVAGPSGVHREAWRLTLPPARPVRRVAVWADDPYCPVDPEVALAVESAAETLARDGVTVERATPPGVRLDVSDEVGRRLLSALGQSFHTSQEVAAIARGERAPTGELGTEYVAQLHRDWLEADMRRHRLAAAWRKFFERYDAILLPVAPNTVPAHDLRPFADRRVVVDGRERPYWDQMVWAMLTGICRLPSTVVPSRLDRRGLPVGVAVAGPYLADRTTLALARRLTGLLPDLGRPDPVKLKE